MWPYQTGKFELNHHIGYDTGSVMILDGDSPNSPIFQLENFLIDFTECWEIGLYKATGYINFDDNGEVLSHDMNFVKKVL